MSVVVALEGILRNEHGVAIPGGLKLYMSLVESYRIVISTSSSKLEAERWCAINGVRDYAELYDRTKIRVGESLRSSHLAAARASGGQVEFLLDSDSQNCAEALEMGIPSFFYAAPGLISRKTPIRSWEEITEIVERQKELAVGLETDLLRYE